MSRRDIIAIGGSLGAVGAVKQLCQELPADLAATMFIVIHVGAEGNNLLAEIFNAHSPISIKTAVDGEVLQPGKAYVAPADHHLLVIGDEVKLGRGPREIWPVRHWIRYSDRWVPPLAHVRLQSS